MSHRDGSACKCAEDWCTVCEFDFPTCQLSFPGRLCPECLARVMAVTDEGACTLCGRLTYSTTGLCPRCRAAEINAQMREL